MLLNNKTLDGIINGEISIVFRVWKRPTVKPGGKLTTRKGVLQIEAVEQIDRSEVTDEDIRNAGLNSREQLCEMDREGKFYRIRLRFAGEDPRIALRQNIDEHALQEICRKLKSMGEWTCHYLQMIRAQPNIHAQILADLVGLEKRNFKARVRRLKSFGLTESLRPGYRLSPRGEKVLEMFFEKPN